MDHAPTPQMVTPFWAPLLPNKEAVVVGGDTLGEKDGQAPVRSISNSNLTLSIINDKGLASEAQNIEFVSGPLVNVKVTELDVPFSRPTSSLSTSSCPLPLLWACLIPFSWEKAKVCGGGRRNGGGDAVAVAGCKGRSVTVATHCYAPTVTFFKKLLQGVVVFEIRIFLILPSWAIKLLMAYLRWQLPKSRTLASSSSSSISLRMLQIQVHGNNVNGNPASALVMSNNKYLQRRRAIVVTSVAEEDTLIPEEAAEEIDNIDNNNTEEIKAPEDASTTMTDQPVSVPVSPSDILTMFFQAEGAMNETAIPTVTNALEETEGITNLKVQVVEGIATVEVSPSVEANKTEPDHVKPPAHAPVKAPVHSPVKAPPVHAPEKAPIHPPPKEPYHHAPAKAPVHSPVKAPPAHAPEKAPIHPPPKEPYHHAPAKAPVHHPEKHHHHHHAHAPKEAPEHHHHAYPPKTGPIHHPPVKAGAPVPSKAKEGCYPMCEKYCKKDKKRPCVKDCVACCEKFKCVPEHKKKCDWYHVKIDGKMIKCP
ncbi:hypothetical protein TEA_019064 [Camellia sinensis var. sinensis]|uniref:Uncharacterized protein n=1 Tax=Camellia sinensis var. sinensis TaxID=542762 RepID=A0A4S4ES18_CAMSN|nr:hypothetical protein TEA_019064 [Camellia sinensis var. sinensis]